MQALSNSAGRPGRKMPFKSLHNEGLHHFPPIHIVKQPQLKPILSVSFALMLNTAFVILVKRQE